MRVNEVYSHATIQGEGPHTGRLCTFVRLWGCNLHCRWCDTPYTWDTTGRNGTPYPMAAERYDLTPDEVAERVLETGAPICVVSGGEPLLQYRDVLALAALLDAEGVRTHVESNGTINPDPADDWCIAHYSISPKLPSAEAGDRAIHLATLRRWALHPRAIFKTVVSTHADIDAAVALYNELGLTQSKRWVMPEAVTASELDARLPELCDLAVLAGLNVSTRLHVQAWGTTRGR